MGALASAVRQGKALYAGLSNYDGETAARAAALLEAGGCPFVVCQNRYSMLDRTVEHNGLLAFARGAGKGVVAFSPLAQGLLSGRYLHGIPQGSRIARGNSVRMTPQALTPALMQGLEKLGALAAARGQTLAQFALSWVLSAPGVTSVLVGASSAAQLRENVACLAAAPLSQEEREAAAALLG